MVSACGDGSAVDGEGWENGEEEVRYRFEISIICRLVIMTDDILKLQPSNHQPE